MLPRAEISLRRWFAFERCESPIRLGASRRVPSRIDCLLLNPYGSVDILNNDLANLTRAGGGLDQLIDTITRELPYVKNVYLTEYRDLPRDASGNFCNISPLPDFQFRLQCVHYDPAGKLYNERSRQRASVGDAASC